jgi:hypothetical protein
MPGGYNGCMDSFALIDRRSGAVLGRYPTYRLAVSVRIELVRLHPAAAEWAEVRRETSDAPGPLPSAA